MSEETVDTAQETTDAAETTEETTLLGGTEEETTEETAETAEEGTEETTEEKPEGAPEEYEPFTAPEGMTLDEELLGEFSPMAKDMNLTQEQAQKMVDMGAQLAQKIQNQQEVALKTKQRDWREAVKKDADMGGANLQTTLKDADKGLKFAGDDEFISLVKGSWLGDHPGVIRFLAKVGKTISEDTAEHGTSGGDVPLANRLFPSMK